VLVRGPEHIVASTQAFIDNYGIRNLHVGQHRQITSLNGLRASRTAVKIEEHQLFTMHILVSWALVISLMLLVNINM
jgi:hypothetical protein